MRTRKWIKAFYHPEQGKWTIVCYVCGTHRDGNGPPGMAYHSVDVVAGWAHEHLTGHNRGLILP